MIKRVAALVISAVMSAGVTTVVAGGAAAAPAGAAATRAASFDTHLVTLINRARQQHGLRPLRVARGTTTVAKHWAAHLAELDALEHNPQLVQQLQRHGSANWTDLGENVAVGTTARGVFRSYMHSPEHRANVLNPRFRYVGAGVAFGHRAGFNVLDFVDRYHR